MHEASNELSDNIEDEPRPTLALPEQPIANTTEHLINEYEEQNKKNAELFDSPDSCKIMPIQTNPCNEAMLQEEQTDNKKTQQNYFSFKDTRPTAPVVETTKKSVLASDMEKELKFLQSKISGLEDKIKKNTATVMRPHSTSESKQISNRTTSQKCLKTAGKLVHVSSSIEPKKGSFKSNIRDKNEIGSKKKQCLSSAKKMDRHILTPKRSSIKPFKKSMIKTAVAKPVVSNKENMQLNAKKGDERDIAILKKEIGVLQRKIRNGDEKYNRLYKEHCALKNEYESSEALRKKQKQLITNLRSQIDMSAGMDEPFKSKAK